MHNLVKAVVERIRKQDREYFRNRSTATPALPPSLATFLQNSQWKVTEYYSARRCWPSKKWVLHTSVVDKGAFHAEFETHLKISKLAPVFHIHHEFGVRNADDERVVPTLGGFGGQPYNLTQFRIEEEACNIMTSAGYARLSLADLGEAIPDLSFQPGVTLFGPQVTVEHVLFHDFLEWCGDERPDGDGA